MNYDKRSFLSGIAVGRQLKGWSMAGGLRRQEDPRTACLLAGVPVMAAEAAVSGAPGGSLSISGILHAGEFIEAEAEAAALPALFSGSFDIRGAGETVVNDTETAVISGLPAGVISIGVILEVEE